MDVMRRHRQHLGAVDLVDHARLEEEPHRHTGVRVAVVEWHVALVTPPELQTRPVDAGAPGHRAKLTEERHRRGTSGQCNVRRAAIIDGRL
jgi:hypothetical protein